MTFNFPAQGPAGGQGIPGEAGDPGLMVQSFLHLGLTLMLLYMLKSEI